MGQATPLEYLLLNRLTEITPPQKRAEVAAALEIRRGEFPTLTNFAREFSSYCFALAPGVSKTRLMGAFISYLHLAGCGYFMDLSGLAERYGVLVGASGRN